MFDMHRVELDWGGRKLVLETGRVARQADGAVLATYGGTTVIATVVAAKAPKEGIDFLPLTVNYTEKYYAAGRIPGGYFKRERGPTAKDTLTSVSYTHLRAHETDSYLVCRLLLEKKKKEE